MNEDVKKFVSFGLRLRQACDSVGLQQRQLADIIGVSRNTISAYVKGVQMPNGDKLLAIAKALNVSLDWLLLGKEPAPPRVASPGVEDTAPSQGLSANTLRRLALERGEPLDGAVPKEMGDLELLLTEFGAWARRNVARDLKLEAVIEGKLMALRNQVEKELLKES